MEHVEKKPDKRIERWLGIAVVAALILVGAPRLHLFLAREPGQRAATLAEELARDLADYRQETGRWPRRGPAGMDLTVLAAPATADPSAMPGPLAGTNGPLVREVPLDPWGRPFRAVLLERGRGLAVMSAGPDGRFDTATERLWDRRGLETVFDGDDEGFLLELDDGEMAE